MDVTQFVTLVCCWKVMLIKTNELWLLTLEQILKKKYCSFITYRGMEDNKGTDLNDLVHDDFSSTSGTSGTVGTSIKKVPSLPELKPHFIVKEYCGRPRRESQTLYLEGNFKKENIDENDRKKQKKKQSGGMMERVALLGGAMLGGALGLYIYGSNGGD